MPRTLVTKEPFYEVIQAPFRVARSGTRGGNLFRRRECRRHDAAHPGRAFFFLRLLNSQIEVDLPLIGYYPPDPRPDAGLRPDVFVEPKAVDIARGIDTELRAVETLLRRRR